MEATYSAPDKQQTFTVATQNGPLPEDNSRDAVVEPDTTTPLGKLRSDILSIQHQVNVFLTDRMGAAKAAQAREEEIRAERAELAGEDPEDK